MTYSLQVLYRELNAVTINRSTSQRVLDNNGVSQGAREILENHIKEYDSQILELGLSIHYLQERENANS